MTPLRWNKSILETTLLAVLTVACVITALFIVVTVNITDRRAHESSTTHLSELIESAANTASVACFVEDETLAIETARGMLKNSEVLGVVIRSQNRVLAQVYRDRATVIGGNEPRPGRLLRPLYSPFSHQDRVGEILLDADMDGIRRTINEESRYVALLLIVLVVAVVVAVATVVSFLVVRPVQAISNRVHQMDVAAGETIPIPLGHSGTELGRLIRDINALVGRLFGTLQHEQQLRLTREMDERKYHAIFDNAEAGIFVANQDGVLESFNPALGNLFRLSNVDEGSERRLASLPWTRPDRLADMLTLALNSVTPQSEDMELTLPEDRRRWLHVVLRPIGNGLVQGMATDVTERRQSEADAQRQLVTDKLTGLPNRNGLESELGKRLNPLDDSEPIAPFAVLLVDLDGFRRVNDAVGLPSGDQVLINAARRLAACLEETAFIARTDADEFAAIVPLPGGEEEAARIGERLVQVLNFSFLNDTMPVHLGASIGIALYPGDGEDLPTLLRSADLAQGQAQANGGGRFQFYDATMAEAAEQRRLLDADLRLAVRRKEFRLHFQPIVDLSENRLAGAEALIRWQRREHGLIMPDAFIPAAEETGFIREIGHWVLETACDQLARWSEEGLDDLYISVNVSGLQIPDGLPPSKIFEIARRHGVSPRRLVLEITEGILISDVVRAQAWLDEVREKGFRIYLDDFGTGYSSLSYLKRFAVNSVKVDKSFVRDMAEDVSDRKLVAAVISMAGSLGLTTVAEGVETGAQLEILRGLNCRYVQGYHFSRPVPAADFPAAAERVRTLLAA